MQSLTEVDKEDLFILNINCKGKRTVGKANKGINVEKNNNSFKKIFKEKRKEKNVPQNCKSPTQRQRFIRTIKSVTEKKKKKLKSLIRFHSANDIDSYNRVGKDSKESAEQVKT